METNSKNHCKICKKDFAHKQSLYRHKKTGCGKMTFPCPKCSKILGRKVTLKLHLAKCKGNVNLLCGDCNKEFQSPWHLKRHQRQKHIVEKSFSCDKCSRKISSQG